MREEGQVPRNFFSWRKAHDWPLRTARRKITLFLPENPPLPAHSTGIVSNGLPPASVMQPSLTGCSQFPSSWWYFPQSGWCHLNFDLVPRAQRQKKLCSLWLVKSDPRPDLLWEQVTNLEFQVLDVSTASHGKHSQDVKFWGINDCLEQWQSLSLRLHVSLLCPSPGWQWPPQACYYV